jgi:hypothetical protein
MSSEEDSTSHHDPDDDKGNASGALETDHLNRANKNPMKDVYRFVCVACLF